MLILCVMCFCVFCKCTAVARQWTTSGYSRKTIAQFCRRVNNVGQIVFERFVNRGLTVSKGVKAKVLFITSNIEH